MIIQMFFSFMLEHCFIPTMYTLHARNTILKFRWLDRQHRACIVWNDDGSSPGLSETFSCCTPLFSYMCMSQIRTEHWSMKIGGSLQSIARYFTDIISY